MAITQNPKTFDNPNGYNPANQGSSTNPGDLVSMSYMVILDLLSEGEIDGLVDDGSDADASLKSIYLNGTPIRNPDGSYNYKGISWVCQNGTQDQSYVAGFPDAAAETAVGLEIKFSAPLIQNIPSSTNANAVVVTIQVPQLYQVDAEGDEPTGDQLPTHVTIGILVQNNGGGFVQQTLDANGLIQGKCINAYERQYRVPLTGTGPWDIKVERLTPDNHSATLANQTYWKSYSIIIDAKLAYPNSAYVGTEFSADLFSSAPTRSFLIRGIKVKVPTNYDPETRTYDDTEVWDGSFKVAWTDNPAWCFYDLVLNPRYGLGKYITSAGVDKWSLYTIGRYCDELVPDGKGGMEPRFTANIYLQKQEDAYKVVNNFAAIFRGMAYWGSGALVAVQDSPADPDYLFVNANVVDGVFKYSSSAQRARHNVAIVSWNDPGNHYAATREYVTDEVALATSEYNPIELGAMGCTSQGQAQRVGRWVLISERLETETIAFKCGLEGALRTPGSIILVQDQYRAGLRLSGRLDAATLTTLSVDQDLVIEEGKTYTVSVIMGDGSIYDGAITSSAGTYRKVGISPAMPSLPEDNAVWVAAVSDLAPVQYRLLSIVEAGDGTFDVTGLKHIPTKYAEVEDGVVIQAPITSIIPSTIAPTNLTLGETLYISSTGVKSRFRASWDQNSQAVSYALRWKVGADGNWSNEVIIKTHLWELLEAVPGTYTVQVQAIFGSIRTNKAVAIYTVLGKTAPPADVTGFSATVHPLSTTLRWDAVPDVDLDHYELRTGDGPDFVFDSTFTPTADGGVTQMPITQWGLRSRLYTDSGTVCDVWIRATGKLQGGHTIRIQGTDLDVGVLGNPGVGGGFDIIIDGVRYPADVENAYANSWADYDFGAWRSLANSDSGAGVLLAGLEMMVPATFTATNLGTDCIFSFGSYAGGTLVDLDTTDLYNEQQRHDTSRYERKVLRFTSIAYGTDSSNVLVRVAPTGALTGVGQLGISIDPNIGSQNGTPGNTANSTYLMFSTDGWATSYQPPGETANLANIPRGIWTPFTVPGIGDIEIMFPVDEDGGGWAEDINWFYREEDAFTGGLPSIANPDKNWYGTEVLTKQSSTQFEWGHPADGSTKFNVRAVDTSGNLSLHAATATATSHKVQIQASALADRAVGSHHLLQPPHDNLVPNGFSEAGADAVGRSPEGDYLVNDPTNAFEGNWCRKLLITASGLTQVTFTDYTPCLPGDQFRGKMQVKASGTLTGSGQIEAWYYDKDKAYISDTNSNMGGTALGTGFREYVVPAVAPAGACYIKLGWQIIAGAGDIGKTVYLDAIELRKAIDVDLVIANTVETNNYSEAGGVLLPGTAGYSATAGVKLDSQGPAFKTAYGAMYVGDTLLDQPFFRALNALYGSPGSDFAFYKGNTAPGGVPDITKLTVRPEFRVGTTGIWSNHYVTIITPSSNDNNLDGLRYMMVAPYYGTSAGATATSIRYYPINDRLYGASSPSDSINRFIMSFDLNSPNVVSGAGTTGNLWYLQVTLVGVFGKSNALWFTPPSTYGSNCGTSTGSPFSGAPAPPAGGGLDPDPGGACPAPWVPIRTHKDGSTLPAKAFIGAKGKMVWTRHETTGVWGYHEVLAAKLERNIVVGVWLADGRYWEGAVNHKFCSEGKYTDLRELKLIESELEGTVPGRIVRVEALGYGDVVQMTVKDAHTMEHMGILGHNARKT